jgi:hypothetical protein
MATDNNKLDPSVTHPDFDEFASKVAQTEDAFNGTVEKYVVKLQDQTDDEYQDYINRGSYYNMVGPTTTALIGAMTRKPYTLNGGSNFPQTDFQTPDVYLQHNFRNVLLGGRTFILVTVVDGASKLVAFDADDVINWSDTFKMIRLVSLVPDPVNPYKQTYKTTYLELYLGDDTFYHSRVWEQVGGKRGKWVATDNPDLTLKNGQLLDYIPLYIATPFDTSWNLINPPLFPQASINIRHFRMSCDLGHYFHFMALPTVWVSGLRSNAMDPNGDTAATTRIKIGSTTEVVSLSEQGRIGFAEVTGQACSSFQSEMKNMEDRMIQVGSRLMTNQKNGVESAQALQLRLGNDHAMLETIVNATESALNDALAVCNQIDGTNLTITLNNDFAAEALDALTISAMLQAVIAGAITPAQFVQALAEAELIDGNDVKTTSNGTAVEPSGENDLDNQQRDLAAA